MTLIIKSHLHYAVGNS